MLSDIGEGEDIPKLILVEPEVDESSPLPVFGF
jgi:hypothetical protein